jgi:hypothetical protein
MFYKKYPTIPVGFEFLTAVVMKSTIFWDIMPRSLCLPPAFTLASCSSTLKMETICSSETSVDFQQTTWRYIPEDSTLHLHLANYFNYNDIITAHNFLPICDVVWTEKLPILSSAKAIIW